MHRVATGACFCAGWGLVVGWFELNLHVSLLRQYSSKQIVHKRNKIDCQITTVEHIKLYISLRRRFAADSVQFWPRRSLQISGL